MIAEAKLDQLARLESDEGIVSFFVRLEPRLMYERGLPAAKFKSALERFRRRETSEKWRNAAERERERIQSFLEDWTAEGKGLALFACEPKNLWEVLPLGVAVPTWLGVGESVRTRPLAVLLDEFPRIGIAVVQRDKATLYVSEQGEGEESEDLHSNVPAGHSQGGWSQARFGRRIELKVGQHLEGVVEALRELDDERPIQRLILGGTSEVTAELLNELPENLRARWIGSMPVDVKHATQEDILEHALELSEHAEREEEKELVERVLEGAGGRGGGVVGLEDVLRAVVEGRLRHLVLTEEVEGRGCECTRCGYLTLEQPGECPLCSGPCEPAPGIVDVAVERAVLGGAEVNFVFDGPAEEELSRSGGIGALLHY